MLLRQLLIGDCHFGRHANSVVWLENQLNFFNIQIFDILKTKNIDRVVFLGDLFDIRYSTNTQIGCELKLLLRKLITTFKNIDFIIIAGNHDFYSPQEELHNYNSYEMIFGEEFISYYNNLKILIYEEYYDKVTKDLYLPWYSTENFNTFQDTIFKYKEFGINNIFVHSDIEHWDNSYKSLITSNMTVWSGHIHYKWHYENFNIIGATYSFDFSDVNQNKYVYIIENNKCIEKIENTTTPKFKRFYNDDIFKLSENDFKNSYIELYIFNSNSNKAKYIERLKEIDKEYSDYNVRKHIIDDSMGEDFHLTYFNANIDNYIENNIPEYLTSKFNIIKSKVKNNEN